MNSFVKGMGSLNLFPPPAKKHKTTANSAWYAVGNAFRATGDCMRKAINAQTAQPAKPVAR
jgi:hypothetical protein